MSEEDGMDTICTAFPMIRVPKLWFNKILFKRKILKNEVELEDQEDEGFGYITPGGNMMGTDFISRFFSFNKFEEWKLIPLNKGATRISFGPWHDLPETLSENGAAYG